jgi:hypothetical protein
MWLIVRAEDRKMDGIHDHDNEISYFIQSRVCLQELSNYSLLATKLSQWRRAERKAKLEIVVPLSCRACVSLTTERSVRRIRLCVWADCGREGVTDREGFVLLAAGWRRHRQYPTLELIVASRSDLCGQKYTCSLPTHIQYSLL